MGTANKRVNKTLLNFLVLAITAIGFYYITLWATPYYVQLKFASKQKTVPNTIRFAPKPSAENLRVVPLPNPDFLYSSIGYNVSDSVLKITGPVPDSTYWSLSAYQANTTNFFVVNDQQVHGRFEFYVVKEGTHPPFLDTVPKSKIITTPTSRGLVLFRYLISKTYVLDSLSSLQHKVTVETIKL